MDASIVDSPHAPDGSTLIEVVDDREDLRTEEEQAQEQAYQIVARRTRLVSFSAA